MKFREIAMYLCVFTKKKFAKKHIVLLPGANFDLFLQFHHGLLMFLSQQMNLLFGFSMHIFQKFSQFRHFRFAFPVDILQVNKKVDLKIIFLKIS